MILEIKKILEKNNINFVLHQQSNDIPIDKIDVELLIENYPPGLSNKTEIILVPDIEKATAGLSLLQFYTVLNLKISEKEEIKNELMQAISDINYTLAVGSFILNQNEGYIYLKYNLAFDQSQNIDFELILTRVLWLIERHFNTYANLFFQINNESLLYKDVKS
jgi:hypothetical protein